jgi:hypothetical protein
MVGGHFWLSEEPAPSLSNVHRNATSGPLNGQRQGREGARQGSLKGATDTGRSNRLALPRPRPSRDSVQPGRYYNKVWCCRVPNGGHIGGTWRGAFRCSSGARQWVGGLSTAAPEALARGHRPAGRDYNKPVLVGFLFDSEGS